MPCPQPRCYAALLSHLPQRRPSLEDAPLSRTPESKGLPTSLSGLPAAASTDRSSVAARVPAATSATTATAAAAATPAVAATTATAAAVARHLSQTRVDLLLGLSEHADEVTSLLGIYTR